MIFEKNNNIKIKDELSHTLLAPVRVVWQSDGVDFGERLITEPKSQVYMQAQGCVLQPGSGLLLDFGMELPGGVRIVTGCSDAGIKKIHLRFGESVSEAMNHPNNDHALHDMMLEVPSHGMVCYGRTGFRFVRIDCDAAVTEPLILCGVFAEAIYRDLPRVGNFECDDAKINEIYKTAVRTVHWNMQDYIYDGIKRDRIAWIGDMNPEIKVILNVFQDTDVVKKSLDFVRDLYPLPKFMNNISSYSLWWIINQYEYFFHCNDRPYLLEQRDYLTGLLKQLCQDVLVNGSENLSGKRFLDWPTKNNENALHAGLHGLLAWTFRVGAELCSALQENECMNQCRKMYQRMLLHQPECNNNKQAAAMLTIGGVRDCSDVLLHEPFSGISTFYGYYMLMAQPVSSALKLIRRYWGGMLDFGATTFWEDFDLAWTKNAYPIDSLPIKGKEDIHGSFGNYCYRGLRHSLCHGWSGGPAAYLAESVLGIRPLTPGFKTAIIQPNFAGLDYIKGSVPTPWGPITVEGEKGKVKITKPKEVNAEPNLQCVAAVKNQCVFF
ncbi:MAG: alpha-L-rhamnosidase C-terminal domain-containing protein [Lentisphaeria bacterium]